MDNHVMLPLILSALAGTKAGMTMKKIGHAEFDVTTDSTTAETTGTVDIDTSSIDENTFLWVHIRDKAGKRAGYFYGSDCMCWPVNIANGSTAADNRISCAVFRYQSDGTYNMNYTPNGVYCAYFNMGAAKVVISDKYSSTYTLTIDGTYTVDVFEIKAPKGITLFEVGSDDT